MAGDAYNSQCRLRFYTVLLALFLLFCIPDSPARADSPLTAVLYPEIREPFRTIFTSIADGVGSSLDGQVVPHAITDEDSSREILDWLNENHVEAAVVLGSRGQTLSKELPPDLPVVIGAVHMSQELLNGSYDGITLNPDPALLLGRLKSLAPSVKRVTIVYHRQRDQWMIEMAREPARELGLILNPIPVDRLQEAANKYLEILQQQKSDTEALWLSQDSAVLDEQAVLPMILKEAWDRRLIVFSSNPSHVRRGVLFALYPDNRSMGESLGRLVLNKQQHPAHTAIDVSEGMQPLSDLLIAFNVRTAGRLGIRYTRQDLEVFDLVFPPL